MKLAIELLRIIKKFRRSLAINISKDTKKTLHESNAEVESSIKILNYAIQEFKIFKINCTPFKNKKSYGQIFYEPIGCVAFITPWNYPILTIFERMPFAILAGCNIILKPSELTPKFNIFLKKILEKNILISSKIKVLLSKNKLKGQLLTKSKKVDMISFVGSTKTAKQIIKQSSNTIKKVSLELGGKNIAIILDDNFNIKMIDEIILGIFENSGRACVAISRILVNKKIYDDFISLLKKRILEKLNNKKILFRKIQKFEKKNIKKIISSIDKRIKSKDKNYIFNDKKEFCLIISNKNSNYDKFLDEEFFFPIVSCEIYKNRDELIKKANNSKYGLACYIFSNSNKKIINTIKDLHYGRLWINSGPTDWHPSLPVGGKKMSGKSFDMGNQGFLNYLIPKSVYITRNLKNKV